MAPTFEPSLLPGHIYTLGDSSCIRFRLARTSDVAALRDLLEQARADAPDLEAARLVHFDPRRRYVVCAAGLVDSSETLLGIGSISLDEGRCAEPDLLIVADRSPQGLRRLLRSVLLDAVGARARAA
jgi:hypothetical protein